MQTSKLVRLNVRVTLYLAVVGGGMYALSHSFYGIGIVLLVVSFGLTVFSVFSDDPQFNAMVWNMLAVSIAFIAAPTVPLVTMVALAVSLLLSQAAAKSEAGYDKMLWYSRLHHLVRALIGIGVLYWLAELAIKKIRRKPILLAM